MSTPSETVQPGTQGPHGSYIRAALDAIAASVPDLCFGLLNGHNLIRFDVRRKLKSVQLISGNGDNTGLKSVDIVIDANGQQSPANLTPVKNKQNNAVYQDFVFDEPRLVDSIELRSDRSTRPASAWNLIVSGVTDTDGAVELYSHETAIRLLHQVLARRRTYGRSDFSKGERQFLDTLILYACQGRFVELDKALKSRNDLPWDTLKAIRSTFNALFFSQLNLEWTNHGPLRSFRFWSVEQKVRYLRFAQTLIETLESHGIHACLGYGGTLSVVRDGDLIPHDDDLDVLVAVPRETGHQLLSAVIEKVSAMLIGEGYLISGDYLSHRHATAKTGQSSDVFFGFIEGDHVSWFPGPRRKLHTNDVFPPVKTEILGVEVSVPKNIMKYVATVYGADWRHPIPGWNHSWDRTEYKDWF